MERRTVLITEDDKPTRISLDRLMRRDGYNTRLAEDGMIAIKIVRHENVDLAILDINVPRKSGIETLKEIKVIRRDLPVVMITGQPSKEILLEILDAGAYSFMIKPFDIYNLRKLVKEIFQTWKYQS